MFRRRVMVLAVAVVAIVGAALITHRTVRSAPPVIVADTTLRPTVLGDFNVRVVEYQGRRYFYQVFLPRTYSPSKRWPVIMALHGSGRRGSDNAAQLSDGLGPVVREQAASFPAVVIFPQVPERTRESTFVPVAFAILDQAMRELNGDPSRVYLTGFSYGGYLAYDLAYTDPARFAALVPIGALFDLLVVPNFASMTRDVGYASVAQRLRGLPMWVFQGALDPYTKVMDAHQVVDALKTAGVNVTYTEFPDGSHDVTGRAYRTPAFYSWLYAQHR